MAGESGSQEHDDGESGLPRVTVCRSCPDRRIFIEDGNTDGWIASDFTVDLRP